MERGGERQRQHRAEGPGDEKRQRRADGEAGHRAQRGEGDHLRQIDREDARAGRAERFQRGDRVPPAVEMAFHRVRHADAPHQQRGEPDQREELHKALDVALEGGGGIGAGAHLPAGLRQLRLRRRGQRAHGAVGRVVVGQAQAVVPAHDAAELQQAADAQGILADEQPRAEADPAGELVGLGTEHGADLDRGGADGDARPRREPEPCQQGGVGGRAERAVASRQHLRERLLRLECDIAVERISAVDRFHLDQRGAAVGCSGHGAHGGGDREPALTLEKRVLGRARVAQAEREGDVAAENDAAFAREPVRQPRRDRVDAGNGHDSERDAADEHVEAAQAPAQFARVRSAAAAACWRVCRRATWIRWCSCRLRLGACRPRSGPSAAARRGRSARRARGRG